ncbi:MAG: glycosyltransferase family 2 protein [Bacteroidia bacterium]|nr:glycosyltransferase family 2 protein [Bacteroidia bacterium]
MNDPRIRVSCIILSWNRKSDLSRVLSRLTAASALPMQIIVVDNASTDGSISMVAQEFPAVMCISLESNIGIAGWNAGMAAACGDYMLLLDDDSYPIDPEYDKALRYLDEHEECGILALRVFNERDNRVETATFPEGPVLSFVGCGVIIRRSLYQKIGGFDEELFLYEHEIEFSMRSWNAGYSTLYYSGLTVNHIASPIHRKPAGSTGSDCRRIYYTSRNILYILLTRFPLRLVLFRAIRIALGRSIASVLHGCGLNAVKGFLHGLRIGCSRKDHSARLSEAVCRMYGYGSYAGGFFFEDRTYTLARPFFLRRRPASE